MLELRLGKQLAGGLDCWALKPRCFSQRARVLRMSFCPQPQLLPEAAAVGARPKEHCDPLRVAPLLSPLSERHGSPAGQGLICLLCVLLQL